MGSQFVRRRRLIRGSLAPAGLTLLAACGRLPGQAPPSPPEVILAFSSTVARGGLLGYGPNRNALYRRAATYVDKILRGASPAELPIEEPTHFDFLVNLKTAQALALTIPPSVLQQATQVIQ